MTNLPDWLVERVALDEVGPHSQARVADADRAELAGRVAALHDDNQRELASHPAGPAVAQIEQRIQAQAARRRQAIRRRWLAGLGLAVSMTGALVLVAHGALGSRTTDHDATGIDAPGTRAPGARAPGAADDEPTRVKGAARLIAFRQAGREAERLAPDAVVHAGDVLQLRYSAGGQRYGVIASLDGAGGVTLHYPLADDAPPAATAMASETTALPTAYALDDAPRFERFFLFTADAPIDVQQTLAALRALARRDDSATATLTVPAGMHQWTLRLRKPDFTPSHEP
jgi:hypothetical protein